MKLFYSHPTDGEEVKQLLQGIKHWQGIYEIQGHNSINCSNKKSEDIMGAMYAYVI